METHLLIDQLRTNVEAKRRKTKKTKKIKRKMKKIAKKCKSDPNLKIRSKLPNKDRSEDSDEGGDRSDDFDQMLPDFSEICGTNRKCVKREWRRFCSLHPTNVYC